MNVWDVQGVGHNDDKVLVLAATNTPYALDQVELTRHPSVISSSYILHLVCVIV